MPRRRHGKKRTTKRTILGKKGPVAILASKVKAVNTRVSHIEGELRAIKYKGKGRKPRRLGTLEAAGSKHWTSGE